MRTSWLNSKKCLIASLIALNALSVAAWAIPKPAAQLRRDIENHEDQNHLAPLFQKWQKRYSASETLASLREIATTSREDTSVRSVALLGYGYFSAKTPNAETLAWMRALTHAKNPWLIRLTALQSFLKVNHNRWHSELDPLLKDKAQIIREEAQRLHRGSTSR